MGEGTTPEHEHCSDYFLETPTPEDVKIFYDMAMSGVINMRIATEVAKLRLKTIGITIGGDA